MRRNDKIITEEQAFARMARLCSQRECCPNDVSEKLVKMNFPEQKVEKIIGKLKQEHYVDEKRFVRSFINDKLRFNKWGKKKIELSLHQKQLPQEVIDAVFSEYSGSAFNQSLQPILERKWESIKGKTEYEKRGKLIKYALSKGFEMKEITSCMRRMNLTDFGEE